jgi:PASTA domain
MMADTFDIFGKPVKKEYVYVGGGVIVVAGIVMIVRDKQAKAAAAAAAPADPGATAADSTADTSDLDPATGLPVDSPEDLSALADQATGYYGSGGGVGTTVPTGFTNNASWAQAAEQYITGGSGGGGPSDAVGNALGKYITGQPVTSDQVSVIDQAIAFENYPPVAGTDGYPPNIRTTTPPTTGGSGGTGGGSTAAATVTVPNVANKTADQAESELRGAGLKPSISITAASSKPGIFHIITKTSPAAGSKVAKNSTVVLYYRDSKTS